MAVAFAILIEVVTVLCAGGIMFAGMMRTTGGDSGDSRSALVVFACGTVVAVLVGASHWVGW
jgi:hypothetical protein